MYLQQKKWGKGNGRWLFLFLFGFILGIIMINLCAEAFLSEGGLLSADVLARLKYTEVNKSSFFLYVLKKRIGSIWLLVLLATTFLGLLAAYAYTFWLGAMTGAFLAALSIRFGMKGILLFLVSAFPHYLLYAPAMALLIQWTYQLSAALYFPQMDSGGYKGGKRQMFLRFFWRLLVIHGVAIIGCLMESYVNPNFITNFLKIF